MFIKTVEDTMVLAFKRGMSFKQVRDRVPVAVSKQLNMTLPEFHAELNRFEAETGLEGMVQRVVSQFTPAEQNAIARRK